MSPVMLAKIEDVNMDFIHSYVSNRFLKHAKPESESLESSHHTELWVGCVAFQNVSPRMRQMFQTGSDAHRYTT